MPIWVVTQHLWDGLHGGESGTTIGWTTLPLHKLILQGPMITAFSIFSDRYRGVQKFFMSISGNFI